MSAQPQIKDLSALGLVPVGVIAILLMLVGGAVGCATLLRRLGYGRRGVTAILFVAAAVVILAGVFFVAAQFDEQSAASTAVIQAFCRQSRVPLSSPDQSD